MNGQKQPLVSVIIPYFNCAKYIEETLNSLESQTYSHHEVILVNDGSDAENTLFIENLLKNKPWIHYIYQENKGLPSARNIGGNQAQGEFLLFLDADDVIKQQFIQKAIDAIVNHNECKLVYSKAELFDAVEGEWELPPYTDFKDLLLSNKIPCYALHRRSDFERINGFDESLEAYEDWDYWIRMLQNGGTVIRLDEVLFKYRQRSDRSSLTDQLLNSVQDDRVMWQKIYLKHQSIFVDNNLGYLDFFLLNNSLASLKDQSKKQELLLQQQKGQFEQEINSLKLIADKLKSHNTSLSLQLSDERFSFKKFKSLLTIKLFKPLIKLEQGLRSINRYRKKFRLLSKDNESAINGLKILTQMIGDLNFNEARKFLKNYSSDQALPNKEYGNVALSLENGITILTPKHTLYVAKLFAESLKEIGVDCKITHNAELTNKSEDWHIVICPQIFDELPKNYLAFQMEQSVSSRWFNDKYFNTLKNAKFVFDYSIQNIDYLLKNDLPFGKLFYLPIGLLKNNVELGQIDYQYDVAFYGDPSCERRRNFLSKLQEHFSVKVISEIFGDELYEMLKKSRIVVNIHYYENALLETTRLYECLSLNKLVVSEKGVDQTEHVDLEGLIDFVDIGDIDTMISRIQHWLDKESDFNKRLTDIHSKQNKVDKFKFYFYRFLLAQDLLEFEEFYHHCPKYVEPKNDFWCLSLPESTERRSDFINGNKNDIWVFDGLRHHIGWIGCGLSYKFMLRKAEDLKLPQVTICEDDVLFYDNFNERYERIWGDITKQPKDWDIFSGLIADLPQDVQIEQSPISSVTENYYTLDKMVSMVFNIYNHSIYAKIYQWDYHYRSHDNTIDRYLENMGGIKGQIVSPFLVGHKEDLSSTLWNFSNSTYSDMIKNSQTLLDKKITTLNLNQNHRN